MKNFYYAMTVIGFVLPLSIVFGAFGGEPVPAGQLLQAFFANRAASAAAADVSLASLVFLSWSFVESRDHGIRHWWALIPINLLVGLCAALPLFLAWRQGTLDQTK